MKLCWRLLCIGFIASLVVAHAGVQQSTAKPAPSPSPSPTNPPTPYMAPEQATNGIWDVVLQMVNQDPSYSTIKLKDVGNSITGVWIASKKTVYNLSGTRDGRHISLDIAAQSAPDKVIGKIDADLDGIADIVGTITLNGTDTPFQAAQHSRVPPPVVPSAEPNPTQTPPY